MAVAEVNFLSESLKKIVPFYAVIPMEQRKKDGNTERFRTLYLLHGYSGNYTDWLFNTRIQQLADWYRVAVIMPSGDNSFYTDNGPKEEHYSTFLTKELPAFTRALFPLSSKREDTLIGGFSMGGYGAFLNGFKHPEVFGSVIALSSAFIVNRVLSLSEGEYDKIESYSFYQSVFGDLSKLRGGECDAGAVAEKLILSGQPVPKLYFACGTEDELIGPNRAMRDRLKKLGADFTYEEGPGEHDWKFWDCHIEHALEALLGKAKR